MGENGQMPLSKKQSNILSKNKWNLNFDSPQHDLGTVPKWLCDGDWTPNIPRLILV